MSIVVCQRAQYANQSVTIFIIFRFVRRQVVSPKKVDCTSSYQTRVTRVVKECVTTEQYPFLARGGYFFLIDIWGRVKNSSVPPPTINNDRSLYNTIQLQLNCARNNNNRVGLPICDWALRLIHYDNKLFILDYFCLVGSDLLLSVTVNTINL